MMLRLVFAKLVLLFYKTLIFGGNGSNFSKFGKILTLFGEIMTFLRYILITTITLSR